MKRKCALATLLILMAMFPATSAFTKESVLDIRQAQKVLKELGFHTNNLRGRNHDTIGDSLRRFQSAHDLKPTGVLDKTTAELLSKVPETAEMLRKLGYKIPGSQIVYGSSSFKEVLGRFQVEVGLAPSGYANVETLSALRTALSVQTTHSVQKMPPVQKMLKELEYGNYRPGEKAGDVFLAAFQRDHGLKPSGKPDEETLKVLSQVYETAMKPPLLRIKTSANGMNRTVFVDDLHFAMVRTDFQHHFL
jgi:murein L,D-transpeptidase YcbB/YkuD